MLTPAWVLDTGRGAQTLGWLLSVFMVAAVLGSVAATGAGGGPRPGRLLIGAASIALMPLGGLLGGVLTDRIGVRASLVIAGLAYLLATMLPVLAPSWRELGRRPTRADARLAA